MIKEWITPGGEFFSLYGDMLTQTHVLIAGATGSGKSTVINGMMHAALHDSPAKRLFVLIDPKKVELIRYSRLPHVLMYSSEPREMLQALNYSLSIVDARYREMQKRRQTEYEGSDVYVIIDELADLLTTNSIKRQAAQVLQRIAQIGRAARVHIVAATQYIPIISTAIRCNFDCRMALRTACAQDSRNIVGVKGAENLHDPKREGRAYGYYRTGADVALCTLHRVDNAQIDHLIGYWMKQRPKLRLFA